MLGLDLLILDHVVGLLDGADICHAVQIGLRAQEVQLLVFGLSFDVPEALGLFVEILRLVHDGEAGLFHADEILPAELSVMAYLGDAEPGLFHGQEPVDHIGVIVRWRVAHGQPAVIRPAEQRDVVFVGLFRRGRDREPAVRDHDVDALILPMQRGRGEVVHFREVGAAVPFDRQLRQALQLALDGPVRRNAQGLPGFLVGAPELVEIEIGLHGRDEDVEPFGQKVLAQLRIIGRLHGVVDRVLRPDGDAPGRIGPDQLLLRGVVHLAVLVRIRGAHEDKVLIIADQTLEDLAAVVHALGAEPGAVIARGGDPDHQLVGVGRGGLLQDGVLLRALVGVHFVGDDDIGVKGVLLVRIAGQGVKGHGAAGDVLVEDHMVERVVFDPPPGPFHQRRRRVERADIEGPAVKRLHGLLERRAHDVHLRAGDGLQQCQRPGQRGDEQRLPVFARDENHRLFHQPDVGAAVVKDQHPVDAQHLPWLQDQRLAAQGGGVERLALPVVIGGLDHVDHEIRVLCADLKILPCQEIQEAPAAQDAVPVGHDPALRHALRIGHDLRAELALQLHWITTPS